MTVNASQPLDAGLAGTLPNLGVVVGTFHAAESAEMLDEVEQYVEKGLIRLAETALVPGSMEKPLALKRLLEKPEIDAAVVLGIIEKGETGHGQTMAEAVIPAVISLQLEYMKPVGVGILGPNIEPQQIASRVKPYTQKAIEAALHMLEDPQR